jgi:hypothetical protein
MGDGGTMNEAPQPLENGGLSAAVNAEAAWPFIRRHRGRHGDAKQPTCHMREGLGDAGANPWTRNGADLPGWGARFVEMPSDAA